MSKTQEAIKLVESGMSAYAAAKKVGINESAVSKGLQRKRSNSDRRCPCCEQIIRDDEVLARINAQAIIAPISIS